MMGKLITTRVNRYEVSGGQHRILGSEILLDFKSFESISESSGGNQPGVLMGVVIGQLWVKP